MYVLLQLPDLSDNNGQGRQTNGSSKVVNIAGSEKRDTQNYGRWYRQSCMLLLWRPTENYVKVGLRLVLNAQGVLRYWGWILIHIMKTHLELSNL